MRKPENIDLHMHTTCSDGTDTPAEIMENVRNVGIELFSVTDHDGIEGVKQLRALRAEQPELSENLLLLNGIEFSCKDEDGKYHILGYGYDENAEEMNATVDQAHKNRLSKVEARLDFLKRDFGFEFSEEDIRALFKNHNPGKPHIANLMIKYGYAETIDQAMKQYLNKLKLPVRHLRPEEAIRTIEKSGGIPILAHPFYGDGDQFIVGEEMDARLKKLVDFGLRGVEAYYSGFTPKLIHQMLDFAEQYKLFISAGSDYHGKNKLIELGETNLDEVREGAENLRAFMDFVLESGMAY